MKNGKKVILALILVAALALLAGCSSVEGNYKKANELMAKGKYTDAAKLFEETGSYEDASRLTMYCKAAAMGESGEYEKAISTFEYLGEFRDCPDMVKYYTARQAEAEAYGPYAAVWAAEMYDALTLYRDSAERSAAIRGRLYAEADEYVKKGQYYDAVSNYEALGGYQDAATKSNYYAGIYLEEGKDYRQAISYYSRVKSYLDAAERIAACRQALYDNAVAKADAGEYDAAAEILTYLGDDYADSRDQQTRIKADRLYSQKQYAEAAAVYATLGEGYQTNAAGYADLYAKADALKNAERYEEAITAFAQLGVYADAAAQIKVCEKAIKDRDYAAAKALADSGKYEAAIAAFTALNGYSDSKAQIKACGKAIKDRDYAAAKALADSGRYEEAIAAFTALNGYSDSAAQITETKYQQAGALYRSGKYAEAYSVYSMLKGYRDVDSLLANDENLKAAAAAAAAAARDAKFAVGNTVTFGTYPQGKNGETSSVEWLVLARNGQKALLISRYGLDAKPYNESYTSVTWENCTLRKWLNGEFLSKAFTAKEQTGILTTDVDNSAAQGYSGWSTSGGNNTQDKVFLLSYAEANKYFGVTYSNNKKARVSPTAYALKQGAYTSSSNKTAEGEPAGYWWLRSPGYIQDSAASVNTDGSLYDRNVNNDYGVVRPALWVDLESGIF